MKYLFPFLLIITLVACDMSNTDTASETSDTQVDTVTTNNALSKELDTMDENKEIDEDKIVVLDATYTNPEGDDVPLEVSYSLDTDGKIDYIHLEGYSHNGFIETAEQELMGKTLQEASNLYVAGASLVSESFQKAIKESM